MHEPYTCIQCNFTCKWKSEYERHLNTPKHRELKKETCRRRIKRK